MEGRTGMVTGFLGSEGGARTSGGRGWAGLTVI